MSKGLLVLSAIVVSIIFSGCNEKNSNSYYHVVDWNSRKAKITPGDSLVFHRTYLPVYGHIYHISQESKLELAITVSVRNTDTEDILYLKTMKYYNTEGTLIREYINGVVEIKACETIEIVIGTGEKTGGSGANFIFEWASKNSSSKPLFESVMISTASQQGISFTSRGVDLY